MAGQAGVRGTQHFGPQRVGDAEAVVMAEVVAHVKLARHMAIHALRTGLALGMAMMLRRVVVFRLQTFVIQPGNGSFTRRVVTLQAHAIARCLELRAVGVVAVAATHALVEHFALCKGAVLEHFILLGRSLRNGQVKLAAQRLGKVVLAQAGASNLVGGMRYQNLITGLRYVSGTGRSHGVCSLLIWLQWLAGEALYLGGERLDLFGPVLAVAKADDINLTLNSESLANGALSHAKRLRGLQLPDLGDKFF